MNLAIRTLPESDLAAADRIYRLAFGTYLGMPDPMAFSFGRNLVRPRWLADPECVLGAYFDGELVASNVLTRWGSFGFFGPLTVRPDLWDQGVASRLVQAAVERFDAWELPQTGLYTFAGSIKHVRLYQKYGYWPGHLTMILSCPITPPAVVPGFTLFSARPDLFACLSLTSSIYGGLDLSREIQAVRDQGLGDTVLLGEGSRLEALAVCHVGPNTEAGHDLCYVKFAGARDLPSFDRLLDAVLVFAASRRLTRLTCGVNTSRHAAYRRLLDRGFRTDIQGIAMQRPNLPGFNRPDALVLDDWR
jgi:GNAT superfamily N-acetyltransferase